MTQSKDNSAVVDAAIGIGLTLAAIVSIGALVWGGGPDRDAAGFALSPFGWHRVIVIHALATLMLSWWLARMLGQWKPPLITSGMVVVWVVMGAGIAVLTIVSGAGVERVIDSGRADYTARLLVRVLWCLALQTPWCLLGLAATRASHKEPSPSFSAANLFGLSVVTAVGVPISFLFIFLDQQTQAAHDAWQQTRLIAARLLVQRLYDVGSTANLGERVVPAGTRQVTVEVTPAMALADLEEACEFVERQIDEMAAFEKLPAADHLKLAQYYVALNRYAEAEATLEPLAEQEPSAALELARVLKEQGRSDESRNWAHKALARAQQANPTSAAETEARDAIQMGAYDMLVVLAGEEADFKTAERYLLEALQQLPNYRASIHSRLASHYEFTGELANALAHQQKAAQAAPEKFAPPDSLLAKMLSSGAPVGLARPKSSRYK